MQEVLLYTKKLLASQTDHLDLTTERLAQEYLLFERWEKNIEIKTMR
jgi:hypothetical protein